MNEKDWIEIDDSDKEAKREDIELLLSQVSADIENRDMRDVLLLVKAAEMSENSLEKSIDLWGQAIDAAYRLVPELEDIIFWMSEAKHFAGEQLQNRLEQLKLAPELSNDPLEAIIKVYQVGSVLYKKHNLEACRVSQIYYYHYHSLIDPGAKDSEDNAIVRYYAVSIAIQAMGFANIANCHHECLAIARSTVELFKELNAPPCSDFDPGEFNHFCNNGRFLLGYYAAIAAKKAGRFPEALDWSNLAEPYVSSLKDAGVKSDFFYWRGEICVLSATVRDRP